jgi:hypothetical protein
MWYRGFLISAYNHVRAQHDGKNADGSANDEQRLTASELDKIHHNYRGFDIDPTMVRTAKLICTCTASKPQRLLITTALVAKNTGTIATMSS